MSSQTARNGSEFENQVVIEQLDRIAAYALQMDKTRWKNKPNITGTAYKQAQS